MSRRWSKLFISSGEEKDVEITKKSDEINDLNVTLENAKVRQFLKEDAEKHRSCLAGGDQCEGARAGKEEAGAGRSAGRAVQGQL